MSQERLAIEPVRQEEHVPNEPADPSEQDRQSALYEQFGTLRLGQEVFIAKLDRPFSKEEVLRGEVAGITIREKLNRCVLYVRKSNGREVSIGFTDIVAIHVVETAEN